MGTRGIVTGKRGKKKVPVKLIVLLSILAVVLILVLVGLYFYSDIKSDINGRGPNGETLDFVIRQGEPFNSVSERLAEAGIIKYPMIFRFVASSQKEDSKIQEGTYSLQKGASYQSIFEAITKPKDARPSVRIGFPEGTEVMDIIDKFLAVGAEKGASWTRAGFEAALRADYDCEYIPSTENWPEDLPDYARLEGFLYPNTYDFYLDATEEELFAKMINEFKKQAKDTSLAAKAKAAGMSVYEAMVLGSIIQKESGNVDDFKLISSVFHNRLDDNHRLESDATVSYMIPKAERLASCTRDQLNKDTPYNVYIRYGLPPTPICCARIEAAVAACEPEVSDYFYFIGTPDGVTVFAVTYKEHQANINKYLK